MDKSVAQFLLGILVPSIFLLVGYVSAFWVAGLRATRKKKSPGEPQTPLSDAHYAALRAEMAELYSTLEKLTTTVTRISSRQGMRDKRARETDEDDLASLPLGTSKAKLLRAAGMSGKVGPAFAAAQLDFERRQMKLPLDS